VSSELHIEIDGRGASAEALWSTASAYGHFTAMQIRGRRTRGLALHLGRLEAANKELFDAGLDREHVRWLIRHALRGAEEASLRIYVFESDEEPTTMITVKPPGGVSTPQRLQSVGYQRPDAHIKHLATGQAYYSRLARRNGFDDALLAAADGVVSESAIANIGFFDASVSSGPIRRYCTGLPCSSSSASYPSWAYRPGARRYDFRTSPRSRVHSSRTRVASRQSARWTTYASPCRPTV
jgi:Amino-transferase class IV